jgi:hypothetical protein
MDKMKKVQTYVLLGAVPLLSGGESRTSGQPSPPQAGQEVPGPLLVVREREMEFYACWGDWIGRGDGCVVLCCALLGVRCSANISSMSTCQRRTSTCSHNLV